MYQNRMKILIIVIRFSGHQYNPSFDYHLPVGLAYLSAVLKQNGYEVDWLNLNHHNGLIEDLIKAKLSDSHYDYILTGTISMFYSGIKECVDLCRKYSRNSVVVLGGGLVTSQPELIFKLLNPDYIVIGEGEDTIIDLLESLNRKTDLLCVDGIGFKGSDGKFKLTKSRKAIKELDKLPFPDYEGLGFDEYLTHTESSNLTFGIVDYPRSYPLASSRSCPFSCTFCFHPIGKEYRQRSIPNIFEELRFAINRYKINVINIIDELFSYDEKRVYEFCKQFKELQETVPWEISWICQVRVDKLNEELLLAMKNAGCIWVSLGLESYSDTILKSMKKRITPKQIDDALKMFARLNIAIQGNFIFGDPAETLETAYETLNYWKSNPQSGGGISLVLIQPYPGTALFEHCLKKGLIKDQAAFFHVMPTYMAINMTDAMSDHEYEQLKYCIYEAELKYNRRVNPRLVENSGGTTEIHVKCPYCKVESIYPNFYYDKYIHDSSICCKSCRRRFFLLSRFSEVQIILSKFLGTRVMYMIVSLYRSIRSKKKQKNKARSL